MPLTSTKTISSWSPHLTHAHFIQETGWSGMACYCALQGRVRTKSWASILAPCTFVSDDPKLLLANFAYFIDSIDIIDISLPVNVLTRATGNHVTTWISIYQEVTIITIPVPQVNSIILTVMESLISSIKLTDTEVFGCLLVWLKSSRNSFGENMSNIFLHMCLTTFLYK